MTKKTAFLFGSGISIPAKIPGTAEITKQILSGEGIIRHSDANYYFGTKNGFYREYVERVTAFVSVIKSTVDAFYTYDKNKTITYEDIYYVISQIDDCESCEFENPVVKAYIDQINPQIAHLLTGEYWHLSDLTREAMTYINCIVWHMINREHFRLDHLDTVITLCRSLAETDIFTLNLDTLLETALSKTGLHVNDGFSEPIHDVRYFDVRNFESGHGVRLIKLHGSINWFKLRPEDDDKTYDDVGIPLNYDFWHTRDHRGKLQWPVDGRPMMLTGTFNKMIDYGIGVFADLHYQFYKSLQDCKNLIICGYGFGDRGINQRVLDWLFKYPGVRTIVIHPDVAKLRLHARNVVDKNWDELVFRKKIIYAPKTIEGLTLSDIALE